MRTSVQNGNLLRKTLIMGVTGAALTAGAVATGAALSNKKSRKILTKGAKRVFKGVSGMIKTLSETPRSKVPAITHTMSMLGGRKRAGRNIRRSGRKSRGRH